MSLANSIKTATETARKVYGNDIYILVARAVAFGNDDNLVIVQGEHHALVALDFARKAGKAAKVTEEKNWDASKVQSLVSF